jgi:hypothetical protein
MIVAVISVDWRNWHLQVLGQDSISTDFDEQKQGEFEKSTVTSSIIAIIGRAPGFGPSECWQLGIMGTDC